MTIAGTSTLHDWVSEATTVKATAKMTVNSATDISIDELEVRVPVEDIVSPKGRIMDNKTYKALKSDDHPEIIYRLTSMKQNGNQITASGKLTIAGHTNTVSMTVTAKASGNAVTFSGEKDLKMTDFKMDPPTALMGTIKTGDDITVAFSVTLAANGTADNSQ